MEHSSSQVIATSHTATATRMPCGITQCYLPPDRGDIPAVTPVKFSCLAIPEGCQAELNSFATKGAVQVCVFFIFWFLFWSFSVHTIDSCHWCWVIFLSFLLDIFVALICAAFDTCDQFHRGLFEYFGRVPACIAAALFSYDFWAELCWRQQRLMTYHLTTWLLVIHHRITFVRNSDMQLALFVISLTFSNAVVTYNICGPYVYTCLLYTSPSPRD